MSKEVADNFIETLWKLEEDRELEPIIEMHTENCNVGNVAVPGAFEGHDGAREFWTSYRKTFGEMKSTFRNVIATDGRASLEWTTEGTEDGDTVSYDGVSILEIDGDKVSRFRAYFNPAHLSRQVVD